MGNLTIVGLGPGHPEELTSRARDLLFAAPEILVSRVEHPMVAWLASQRHLVTPIESLLSPALRSSAESVARAVLERVQASEATLLATPGHPLLDDAFARSIAAEAERSGITVTLVSATSFLDATLIFSPFGQPPGTLQIVDLAELPRYPVSDEPLGDGVEEDEYLGIYRKFEPTRPAFAGPLFHADEVRQVKRWLASEYPSDHRVHAISFDRLAGSARAAQASIAELDWDPNAWATCVFVPPIERLADLPSFDTLRSIVGRLRAPNGCPWDREQDYASIKKHLIEETYEAVAALDESDFPRFAEELGDLILQVVMYAQFGREARDFTMEDVLRSVNEKLIRRHPHVFGDVSVSNSAEVLRNWEKIKRTEKSARPSTFGGIPGSAPALMRADAIQSRATRYGWSDRAARVMLPADVADGDRERRAHYLGDLLFDVVSVARRDKIDPEEALRHATNRFRDAFDAVLAQAQAEGVGFDSQLFDEQRHRLNDAIGGIDPGGI